MPVSPNFVVSSRFPEVVVPNQSLPDFALDEFKRFGNETAFVYTPHGGEKKIYAYSEIEKIVKNLSKGMQRKYSLAKGEVVAICLSNCPEFLCAIFAIQRVGAIATTSNPASTVEEMVRQFVAADVRLIITEDEYLGKVREVSKELKQFKDVIVINRHSNELFPPTTTTFDNLIEIGKTGSQDVLPLINPQKDVCFILFSSGTTGPPKGVMQTHANMVTNICQTTLCRQPAGSRINMVMPHRGDVVYSPFPYFHTAGIWAGLLWPLVQGAKIICMPKWDLEQFLRNVENYRINVLILLPPVAVFLAKSPLVSKYDLSSIKIIMCGAAPMSKETAEEVWTRMPGVSYILQLYGMTELSPLSQCNIVSPVSRQKLKSCGVVTPSTLCKVIDPETGNVCGANKVGELWIHGPQIMKGYLKNEKATKDMITDDGWLKTGDIGYFDEDEYFYISDRLKELIKVKGFQVAPAELEALILTHPSVVDVAVVGVPDSFAGELPRAYVVLRENHTATKHDIQNHVAAHASSYKRLSGGVVFVDEIPKTGSGKLLRRELRERARLEVLAEKSKL